MRVVKIPIYAGRGADQRVVAYSLVDSAVAAAASAFKWTLKDTGYAHTDLAGRPIMLHRFAWSILRGALPRKPLEIDHVNQNKLDNRIENLRAAEKGTNGRNRQKNKNNKSGYKCVSHINPFKRYHYWSAEVMVNGKRFRQVFPYTDEGKIDAARAVNDFYRENCPDVVTPNPQVETE